MNHPAALAALQYLVSPAILLVLGWILNRKINTVRDDTSATRYQVQNSHETNLREDLDAIREDIGHVHGEVREARRDIGGLREDDTQQRRDIRSLTGRVAQLERTDGIGG